MGLYPLLMVDVKVYYQSTTLGSPFANGGCQSPPLAKKKLRQSKPNSIQDQPIPRLFFVDTYFKGTVKEK